MLSSLAISRGVGLLFGARPTKPGQEKLGGGYAENAKPSTDRKQRGEIGARGGSRTHMRKNPRRILSPQRLPFRHPGDWHYKSNQRLELLQPGKMRTKQAGQRL